MAKKASAFELPKLPPAWRVDGERLKKARTKAGLGQDQLCIFTGVSVRSISRLETGRHEGSPSLEDVGRLCTVLGVDLYWLCNVARPK